jgi:uncharacterized protein YqfA (UPF0365 family)
MTNEKKTIEMAHEAGLHVATDVNWMPIIGLEYAEKLIALARAEEREACAKVCDHMAARCNDIRAAALESAADNIRARGQA